MGLDFLSIGLIFVGIILTLKVATEAQRQINEQKIKLTQFQSATEQCQQKVAEEETELQELEKSVKEHEQDFKTLYEKEKSLETVVRDLERKAPKKQRARMGLG